MNKNRAQLQSTLDTGFFGAQYQPKLEESMANMIVPNSIIRLCMILGLTLSVSGCFEEEAEETTTDSVRPVKTIIVGQASGGEIRRFPARVESSQRADVSFRVSGKIQDLLVAEGERVEAGTVIARLDPTEYQLVVDDRRAQYENAKSESERYAELLRRGVTTRQQAEDREAEFKSAEAALRLAERNLEFTELKAPFSGEIARRFVERFEDVREKQPILSMRDVRSLEVKFDVPERIMIQLGVAEDVEEIPEPDVVASFAADPSREFPVDFRESSAFADPDTQTFEVTYLMTAPEDLLILPGMTATATVDFSEFENLDAGIHVPVDAVTAANDLSAKVWIVEGEDQMSLASRAVEIGELRGNLIQIKSGLEKGERIVVAGVPYLVEGMKVTLMPDVEQAAERQDDIQIRRDAEDSAAREDPETTETPASE